MENFINSHYYIAKSNIHGVGVMSNYNVLYNQIIDVGITYILGIIPQVTEFGSYINHSFAPNCYLYYIDGQYYVVANRFIYRHEEITVDYDMCPYFIKGSEDHFI